MGVCMCSLAGTKACETCPNNRNSIRYTPISWPQDVQVYGDGTYQRGYADGLAEGEKNGIAKGLKKAVEIMKYHPEGEGEWCDTGEDMEWACRSECVERAIKRITAALKEATDGKV